MFSIGDDYWIETGRGDRAFKVDGKALRVRDTLVIEDPSGNELCKVQEKKVRVRDTMEIERGGDTVATVKRALVWPDLSAVSSAWHQGSAGRGEAVRRSPGGAVTGPVYSARWMCGHGYRRASPSGDTEQVGAGLVLFRRADDERLVPQEKFADELHAAASRCVE
jgi:hypothetical protein